MSEAYREVSVSTDQSIYEKLRLPRSNLWVFGYGSLMWGPRDFRFPNPNAAEFSVIIVHYVFGQYVTAEPIPIPDWSLG